MSSPEASPCTTCGACCAHFRVSFYWAEAEARGLPEDLTEAVTPWLSCMVGTNRARPRCVALQGRVGESVSCAVYDQRPDTCRSVEAGDAQCLKARAGYGLEPIKQE
ncbi:YkgJ family cysteine cluster protein [Zoogloea sp.]|uniref:YkgJ family cysteine cluster protein n=1 Tax=Zoogloea sp. TaxID=49181 RepID=UPI0014156825|nr:MAG: YkgJ family cysteine cluster protein [Zoogloea sp.]